jgi:hypothetical protein
MKITFKSGRCVETTQEIVNKLREAICGGCAPMQFFSANGDVILMINISEIESITPL